VSNDNNRSYNKIKSEATTANKNNQNINMMHIGAVKRAAVPVAMAVGAFSGTTKVQVVEAVDPVEGSGRDLDPYQPVEILWTPHVGYYGWGGSDDQWYDDFRNHSYDNVTTVEACQKKCKDMMDDGKQCYGVTYGNKEAKMRNQGGKCILLTQNGKGGKHVYGKNPPDSKDTWDFYAYHADCDGRWVGKECFAGQKLCDKLHPGSKWDKCVGVDPYSKSSCPCDAEGQGLGCVPDTLSSSQNNLGVKQLGVCIYCGLSPQNHTCPEDRIQVVEKAGDACPAGYEELVTRRRCHESNEVNFFAYIFVGNLPKDLHGCILFRDSQLGYDDDVSSGDVGIVREHNLLPTLWWNESSGGYKGGKGRRVCIEKSEPSTNPRMLSTSDLDAVDSDAGVMVKKGL